MIFNRLHCDVLTLGKILPGFKTDELNLPLRRNDDVMGKKIAMDNVSTLSFCRATPVDYLNGLANLVNDLQAKLRRATSSPKYGLGS